MTGDLDSSASLVITAPKPHADQLAYAVRARGTLGVLTQLFADARKGGEGIVITAPFVQADAILELGVLGNAMRAALGRGVLVDIMTTRENLALPLFQELTSSWPREVRLFHPAFPFSNLSRIGSHAKFCIRDRDAAYVGSANLTAPGLGGQSSDQHLEIGLLVGGSIALQLRQFWDYSVRNGIFALWAPNK